MTRNPQPFLPDMPAPLLAATLLSACGTLAGQPLAPDALTPIPVTVTAAAPELVICTTREPERLLPADGAGLVWGAVGEPATASDGTFGAQPRALVELPTPENGGLSRNTDGTLAVTLRYRDDLTWSDGQPFSAGDALLGVQVAAPPEVLDAQFVDDHTLSLTLAREAGYPYVPDAPPLPSHALQGLDPAAIPGSAYAERINPALGPYVMENWSRGDSISLTANPHYAGSGPAYARLQIRLVPDSATLLADLLAGTCDVAADGLAGADLPALQQAAQQAQARPIVGPSALWEHLEFNTHPTGERIPFLADVRVRQAIAYAVNREALAQTAGFGPPLDSWLPPDHWAYPADTSSLARYPYDPAHAETLLAEAGWRDGNGDGVVEYRGTGGEYGCLGGGWTIEEETPMRLNLLTNRDDPLRETIAAQVQSDLRAVGIDVSVERLDEGTLFDLQGPLARREFDMALFAWPATPEPGGVNWWLGADLYRHPLSNETVHDWQLEERFERHSVELLAPNNIPSPANDYHGQNLTGWCDETANLAILQATYALSLSERQAAYAQQQAIFSQQLPTLPLFQRSRVAATRPEVCGVAPGPYAPLTWNIAAWTFDPTGTCNS